MKVGEALTGARKIIAAAEARLLLGHVATLTAAEMAAHPERELAAKEAAAFQAAISRRAAGEPVAYITGSKEFFGREFSVSPAVLVPRPETELLVEVGVGKMQGLAGPRVLDLGVGSGCAAVTLALELPGAIVTAVDLSAEALAVAKANAEALHSGVRFMQSDWFAALAGERFDLIVGNPPYVAEGDPHLGDLGFEPKAALTSGVDGLDAIRRIVAQAPSHLLPGGWLLLEHGYDQGLAVAQLLASAGFNDVEQHADLAGIPRVSGGRMAAAGAN